MRYTPETRMQRAAEGNGKGNHKKRRPGGTQLRLQYPSTCPDCGAYLQAGTWVRYYGWKDGVYLTYCNPPHKADEQRLALESAPSEVPPPPLDFEGTFSPA